MKVGLSSRYTVAINREQTERLKKFIQDEIRVKPGLVMTEVIRLAVDFALSRNGDFRTFLKGKVIVE